MKRFQTILCASLLTLVISSGAFAGDITGKAADTTAKTGDITGKTGDITGRLADYVLTVLVTIVP